MGFKFWHIHSRCSGAMRGEESKGSRRAGGLGGARQGGGRSGEPGGSRQTYSYEGGKRKDRSERRELRKTSPFLTRTSAYFEVPILGCTGKGARFCGRSWNHVHHNREQC